MPYLSIAKRGFSSRFDLAEIVNAILYKLKSGCRWRLLPPRHLFSGEPPGWNTVFHHYRKWCVREEWGKTYSDILRKNKSVPDLYIPHIDGWNFLAVIVIFLKKFHKSNQFKQLQTINIEHAINVQRNLRYCSIIDSCEPMII